MKNTNAAASRRSFLKTSAKLAGGLVISFMVPACTGKRNQPNEETSDVSFAPNAFLRIGGDNQVRILLSHTEMGQGIWTTLTMMIAEELDADWKDIKVEHAPAAKEYFHSAWGRQITGGSSTTWSEFDRYRKAGATARILLVEAAAKKWGVQITDCKTENGYVISGDKKISYGEIADTAAKLSPPAEIPLRTKSQWKYIGKGVKRLDAPEKVNGKAKYGLDVQVEGMLIAVVAHPPVMGGRVKSFDAKKTKQVKGVVQVVQVPNGVAVIAENFWSASEGKKVLQVEWDLGENAAVDSSTQFDIFKKMADGESKEIVKAGDVNAAMKKAAKTIEAEYILPYLAHAAMEPLNCTVKINSDSCDIWTGTQSPTRDQSEAATILGFKPEQVNVHTMFLGGTFGRRASSDGDFVREAVHIGKASGKTIKMVWTREDDMQGGYYRPSFLHRVKVGIGANGLPMAWHHSVTGQILPEDEGKGNTEGISDSPYLAAIPNYYIGVNIYKIDIPVLWFRSVGHTHTAFAMESAVDELAHAAGVDSVEYRRQLLKDNPRILAVLNTAAENAGWGKPLPAGRFQGVAVHASFRSYCAQVVEISLDEKGKVKVHKVTVAIDCGLAVNPDGVKAQMESCVIYALTAALFGEITFKNGQVEQSNFHNYQVLRMNETPLIDVHIVEGVGQMGGAGEPGFPPTAPAVANAIFAATGKRIRRMPFGTLNLKA